MLYCALIASVLPVLWTGCKPTKRQWEMLQLYWVGFADLDELERTLAKRKKAQEASGTDLGHHRLAHASKPVAHRLFSPLRSPCINPAEHYWTWGMAEREIGNGRP